MSRIRKMARLGNIKSDHAVIDIRSGREALVDHFDEIGASPIPVTITGFIDGIWGLDDGISREFSIKVTSVNIVKCARRSENRRRRDDWPKP